MAHPTFLNKMRIAEASITIYKKASDNTVLHIVYNNSVYSDWFSTSQSFSAIGPVTLAHYAPGIAPRVEIVCDLIACISSCPPTPITGPPATPHTCRSTFVVWGWGSTL